MSAKGNASTTGLLAWLPDRERAELEGLLRPGTLRFGGVTRLMAAQLAAAVSEVCARDDHAQPSGRPAHELHEELAVLKQTVVRLEASLGTMRIRALRDDRRQSIPSHPAEQ